MATLDAEETDPVVESAAAVTGVWPLMELGTLPD
jgi:hypothetical protein